MVLRSLIIAFLLGISPLGVTKPKPLFPAMNWGVIEEQKVYRSRKLSSEELTAQIKKYSIRSILCFSKCTEEEKEISRKLKIKYYDHTVNIPEITLGDAYDIIDVLEDSPKPLLIHCRKGADRTGMAAALYYMSIKGESPKTAIKKGLRLRYGHLGKFFMPRIHQILNEYIRENYETAL